MEAVKKFWLLGIFISILSIFAMSYNASAVDFTINLDNYERIKHTDLVQISCRFNNGNLTNSGYSCAAANTATFASLNEIRYFDYYSSSNDGIKKGDLIEWYLVVYTDKNYSLNSTIRGPQYLSTYFYLDTISVEEIVNYDFYFNSFSVCNDGTGGSTECTNFDGYKIYKVFKIVQRVNQDISPRWTFGLYTSSSDIFTWIELDPGIVRFRIMNFNQYRFVGSEENKEVEEKTQEAVDDSQAAGGSSSQDAQTGTTGLLNAITGAVSVISSAQPTNCKINGNMGNLDMGQIDLCANPVPTFIQTIGSLLLILMCVPLAISLFNRFISLFRSFQS